MSTRDENRRRITDKAKQVCSGAVEPGAKSPFMISLHIEAINLLEWLSSNTAGEKWYWQSRDGDIEVAGTGRAGAIADGALTSMPAEARPTAQQMWREGFVFLCGRRFTESGRRDALWSVFSDEVCVVPDTMIVRKDADYRLCIHRPVTPESDVESLVREVEGIIQRISADTKPPIATSLPAFQLVKNIPDRNGWERNVRTALEAVGRGKIEKIVLARRTEYRADHVINPPSLLRVLKSQHPGCYVLLYQPEAQTAFLSVTPERLFRRHGREVAIDAVSSTVPRGSSPTEEARFERMLMNDDKLRREHQAVVDGVLHSIKPLCETTPTCGARSVLKLARIQHLATPITALIGRPVTDGQLIGALHPTPAVAGSPRAAAVEMISRLEGFDRGWYAGPIGILTETGAEFAVGIRSAVVKEDTVTVFTGAGIVAGSDHDAEWRELNAKDILRPLIGEKADQ
jgi:menaquinone-specific isochorismate synthase